MEDNCTAEATVSAFVDVLTWWENNRGQWRILHEDDIPSNTISIIDWCKINPEYFEKNPSDQKKQLIKN